jgi:hypothetical protein
MARIVNWRGRDLNLACRQRAFLGLRAAGQVLIQHYHSLLGMSNNGGVNPSYPGQAPRMGSGVGRRAIGMMGRPFRSVVLFMRRPGHHLLALDQGTDPHTISAKGGKKLMIWFRPKPYRAPTQAEIDRIGLKNIGGRWYYFRDTVQHPGTTEATGPGGGAVGGSPWIEPGLRGAHVAMAQAFGAAVV